MYKRITHTITEEHFHHPHALSMMAQIPTAVLPVSSTESEVRFQMLARTYWSRFVWRMRNYIIAITDNHESQGEIATALFKDLDNISSLLSPYWTDEEVLDFNSALSQLISNAVAVVRAIRMGTDTGSASATLAASVPAFSTLMGQLNPESWPKSAVESIWRAATNSWTDQATARMRKNWLADLLASNLSHDILVSGQESGTPGFADIFAQGVISRFPKPQAV